MFAEGSIDDMEYGSYATSGAYYLGLAGLTSMDNNYACPILGLRLNNGSTRVHLAYPIHNRRANTAHFDGHVSGYSCPVFNNQINAPVQYYPLSIPNGGTEDYRVRLSPD
jgi:prepilin-type processing-associated H-X9-DG protein